MILLQNNVIAQELVQCIYCIECNQLQLCSEDPLILHSWPLAHFVRCRMTRYSDGTHDGSLDLLLTGCEVSLWLLEQFAADFAQVQSSNSL
jgi:hypothetical protein